MVTQNIGVILYYYIIVFPITITSLVLGLLDAEYCDNEDLSKLNVSDYLSGFGFIHISLILCYLIMSSFMTSSNRYNMVRRIALSITLIIGFLTILSAIAWFMLGSVIVFRSNIECIEDKSLPVIFALVTLPMSTINIILFCLYRAW